MDHLEGKLVKPMVQLAESVLIGAGGRCFEPPAATARFVGLATT
jgi:hypothetical protein